jgi:hypothetical protein
LYYLEISKQNHLGLDIIHLAFYSKEKTAVSESHNKILKEKTTKEFCKYWRSQIYGSIGALGLLSELALES